MAGGYCLRWTAWRVWLHPYKAQRHMEEADSVQDNLQKRLDEALELLEQQRKATAIQTFRGAELSRQLTEIDKRLADEHRELEETRLKLTKALDSLAEHKSVDEKLAEFEKELSKVEDLKRGYEKRITELEARLGDARKRLAVADDSELVEPIDMLDTRRFPAGPPKLRPNGFTRRQQYGKPGTSGVKSHPSNLRREPVRPGFINRTESTVSSSPTPISESTRKDTYPTHNSHPDETFHPGATSHDVSGPTPGVTLRPEDVARPVIEEKDTTTIEGTPAETAEKVANYLHSLQKGTREKKAGRSEDDWLSELPEL